MTTPSEDAPVRPPRQQRSQRTLDRILDAAERLLLDRDFDRISIQDIVKASGASVGSFYNLFRDKRSLLAGLYERYDANLGDWVDEWRSMQGDPPPDLTRAAAWVARYFVDTLGARRCLLRALALYVRNHPDELDTRTKERRAEQHEFLAQALLAHRSEIRHPEPDRAVRAAIFGAGATCRERILFSESAHASATLQNAEQLQQDVAQMMIGLLLAAGASS